MDAKKGERVSNLFLSRLDGEPAEIALTRGRDRHTRPRFSPDGKTIAFLSDRARPDEDEDEHEKAAHEEDEKEKEKTQVWLVRASGGEPWPLTKLDREIADFGWKDAETLVVAAAEEKSLHEQKMKEAKDTSEVVEDAERTPPVRLFAVADEGRDAHAPQRRARLDRVGGRVARRPARGRSPRAVAELRVRPQDAPGPEDPRPRERRGAHGLRGPARAADGRRVDSRLEGPLRHALVLVAPDVLHGHDRAAAVRRRGDRRGDTGGPAVEERSRHEGGPADRRRLPRPSRRRRTLPAGSLLAYGVGLHPAGPRRRAGAARLRLGDRPRRPHDRLRPLDGDEAAAAVARAARRCAPRRRDRCSPRSTPAMRRSRCPGWRSFAGRARATRR